jgi:hypothetical protein
MKRTALIAAVVLASSLAGLLDPATAQERCKFGHKGNECLNGPLIAGAQALSNSIDHQKFSYSVPLAINAPLPFLLGTKPIDQREWQGRQQYQPTGTGAFLYSCHPNC